MKEETKLRALIILWLVSAIIMFYGIDGMLRSIVFT